MKQQGFTLVELILYIALISIFVTGAIFFSLDIVYGREKAFAQQMVEQNGRSALARIAYEIRRADDINSVSASSIELENGANDTTISLSSGTVQITTGGAGPYDLTSNQVNVSALSFTNLTSTSENTKGINVNITVQQAQSGVAKPFEATTTMSESVELNRQFNDSRALLMDASNASLEGGGKKIEDTTLQNTGSSNITIDKMTVSWTGGTSGSQLKKIEIDGDTVWDTNTDSGTEVDITNVTITSGADSIDIDKIEFTKSMSGAVITVQFKMTDGSTMEVIIDFS